MTFIVHVRLYGEGCPSDGRLLAAIDWPYPVPLTPVGSRFTVRESSGRIRAYLVIAHVQSIVETGEWKDFVLELQVSA